VPLSAGLCCFSSPPSHPWHVTHIGPATVHACVRITRSNQNRYNSKTPQVRLRFMFHYQPPPNRRLTNGAPRTASARPPQEKKHDKRRLSTTAATRHWDSALLAVVRPFVVHPASYPVFARSHLQPIRLHAQPFQGWSVIVNPMRSMAAFDHAGSERISGAGEDAHREMLAPTDAARPPPKRRPAVGISGRIHPAQEPGQL
jgi:hypothetical protein